MSKKFVVLIAEDKEDDIFLMNRAFQKTALNAKLIFVEDGQDAIEYFEGMGKYADREAYPLPHVAILDLKMPRKTGFDALKWLRTRDDLCHIPVMICSSSTEEEDLRKAKELGADSYFPKTGEADALAKEITRFVRFYVTGSGGNISLQKKWAAFRRAGSEP